MPARGGSKGVPLKNLREVGGRPAVIRALIAGRTAPADGRAIRLAPAVALERASSLLQPVA